MPAEVVGFREGRTLLMPLGELQGIGPGTKVLPTGAPFRVPVGPGLLGRVIDGLGAPLDGLGERGQLPRSEASAPPSDDRPLRSTIAAPASRPRIRERVALGVRALDSLVPCGRGQRLGIFAGSGVGKSSLLGMIARSTSATVNVIALVGERGREVREFVERDLGEALERSVVVVATSDQPALVRIKAAFTATTIAEYFRDQGHDVMLMMDSVTRFAMAQREVGLAIGEPPATRGYTPSVFALLPRLLERAGTSPEGSITGLYTVLVDGDDMNEPIADAVRSILDGHIVLTRSLAHAGHYPAIDRPAERLPPHRRDRRTRDRRRGAAPARRARGAAREGGSDRDRRLPLRERPAARRRAGAPSADRRLPAPGGHRARADPTDSDRDAARARRLARALPRPAQRRDPRRRGGRPRGHARRDLAKLSMRPSGPTSPPRPRASKAQVGWAPDLGSDGFRSLRALRIPALGLTL